MFGCCCVCISWPATLRGHNLLVHITSTRLVHMTKLALVG